MQTEKEAEITALRSENDAAARLVAQLRAELAAHPRTLQPPPKESPHTLRPPQCGKNKRCSTATLFFSTSRRCMPSNELSGCAYASDNYVACPLEGGAECLWDGFAMAASCGPLDFAARTLQVAYGATVRRGVLGGRRCRCTAGMCVGRRYRPRPARLNVGVAGKYEKRQATFLWFWVF